MFYKAHPGGSVEDGLGEKARGIEEPLGETKTQYLGQVLGAPLPVGAQSPLLVLLHPRPGLLSLSPVAAGRWEEQGWQS